jgi:DNA-binding NtrC family response regulator
MFVAPSVLVYGRDEFLLTSRAMLLEREGYRVYLALDRETFTRLLRDAQVSILILCHTLREADCLAALDAAAKMRPGIKSLVLTHRDHQFGEQQVSAVIKGLLEPRLLISETAKLTDELRAQGN